MIRTILTLAICLGCTLCPAQRDSSLTEEFGRLSAKQRTRIALKEQEEAARDTEFNALMAQAEKHFQDRSYDEALAVFKEARRRRPYNVHPKVKIQDLEAFIKERDRRKEALNEHAAVQEPNVAVPYTPTEPVRTATPPSAVPAKAIKTTPPGATVSKPINTAATADTKASSSLSKPAKALSAPKVVPPESQQAITPAVTPAQGERIYKEGASIVIERAIERDGHLIVYRKVFQSSGAVVHFEDGRPITQREWDAVFAVR